MNRLRHILRTQWKRLARDLVLLLVIWAGVSWWQTRDLLPSRALALDWSLPQLSGEQKALSDHQGQRVLLYFFAPWCSVCALNIGNLDWLRQLRSEEALAIYAVALDYRDSGEIERYVERHDLDVPVLLGDSAMPSRYRIQAFPTVYVIDSSGFVDQTSVGYVPLLGLWWRSL
ncbi:MAG: TlpA disulfide reductase family protein [bacterium]